MANILLEVKNLKKLYNNEVGIHDISFTINASEVIGFIGPNGSGKTTTIKTILKLLNKDSGKVLFFGKNIDKNFTDIMEFVGYLPSDEVAYENMTAASFLNYSASFYQIDYKDNIISLATRLNLDLNKKIKEMSLGNKKKVGLINALFHEPKVIILDEPTAGLDPLIQIELYKIIKEFKERGSSILLSSHNLNEVQNHCDHILIIKDGLIVQNFTPKEIKNSHKKVTLITKEKIDLKSLNIPEIKNLVANEDRIEFLFAGSANILLKKLNNLSIIDLTIENPSLEELFVHYYL